MSRDLDEAALAKDIDNIIEGYGRDFEFHVKDDVSSPYTRKGTPPRATNELRANENTEEEILEFLISAKDIPFTPYRTMKIIDSKDSTEYRVTNRDPIDSGLITQAYRIRMAR